MLNVGWGLWCLRPLSFPTIFQLNIVGVNFIGGGNRSTEKKLTCRKSVTNLSHNFVSCTLRLSGILTHNVSGDSHWLHRYCKSNYHKITTTTAPISNIHLLSVIKKYQKGFEDFSSKCRRDCTYKFLHEIL